MCIKTASADSVFYNIEGFIGVGFAEIICKAELGTEVAAGEAISLTGLNVNELICSCGNMDTAGGRTVGVIDLNVFEAL